MRTFSLNDVRIGLTETTNNRLLAIHGCQQLLVRASHFNLTF